MKRILRIWMTAMVIAVVLAGTLTTAALAQDEPAFSFSNVQLWVNPEYDDPALLVMLEGTLTGAAPPVTVEFLVPSEAVMYSRGSKDASGNYNVGPNDNRVASEIPGWDIVSFTLETNIFRVEYYDDLIQGSPDKTIDYEFRTLTPITDLSVYVQQPSAATNFAVDPAGAANQDGQGFNIQTYSYPTVDPATPLDFHITYTKTDSAPSLGNSGASTGGSGTSGGSSGGLSNGVVVIIVVVVVAAAAVIIFMTQRSRPVNRADRRRRTGAARRPQAVSRSSGGGNRGGGGGSGGSGGGGGKFCTNCGAPVSANARFCSECGTQRK